LTLVMILLYRLDSLHTDPSQYNEVIDICQSVMAIPNDSKFF
jgi:hypothetical protein